LGSNDDYVSFRKDRPTNAEITRGGGVAILCSPLLNPFLVSSFATAGIESIIIDIHFPHSISSLSSRSIRICLIYRAPSCPSSSLESFLSFINPFVSTSPFIICGDLNFPSIDWSNFTSPTQNDFLSFVSDNHFTQFVDPSIPFADHTSISFSLSAPSPPSRKFIPSRLYHLGDWNAINFHIFSHDWTFALSPPDIDNSFNYFSNFANSLLDTFVPKSSPSPFSRYPRHLRILYGKSKRAKRFERALREHHVRVESRIVDSKSPRAFYSLYNTRLKACKSAPPGITDLDGTQLLSSRDKATSFSKYFASVSTSPLLAPLPTPSPTPHIPTFDLPYLGIIMSPSIKFTDHVSKVVSKARAKINIMFKCFFSLDPYLYCRAFTTFIRPILEYGSVVWSPHTIILANQIEDVQRNFTRRLFARCQIPYSLYPDRLSHLSLQTLEHRRMISDLLFIHKSVHGFYSYDHSNLYRLAPLSRNQIPQFAYFSSLRASQVSF
ncbi:hypothetical protein PENTCL1PPCAC_15011, partial [Pristionchus entomophagus]